MNIQLKHVLLVAGLACATLITQAQTRKSQGKKAAPTVNSLMKQSTLPYNAPDFSKIKGEDYLPAIQAAIAEQRREIKQITDNRHFLLRD